MEHKLLECDGSCRDRGGDACAICEWGMAQCRTCLCVEGTLPSECPGAAVDMDTQDRIFAGESDYRDGKWYEPDRCMYCERAITRREGCPCPRATRRREAGVH